MIDALSATKSRPRRYRFQFTLRTLMLAVTLVAVLLGLFFWLGVPHRREAQAARAIQSLGGRIDGEEGPGWTRWLYGNANYREILSVDFDCAPVPAGALCHVNRLPHLHSLVIWPRAKLPPGELRNITSLPALRVLCLESGGLCDEDLAALHAMPNLTDLTLQDKGITDEGLRHVASLPELKELAIWFARTDGSMLSDLKDLPHLHRLTLWQCPIRDENLVHLRALKSLESLTITRAPITGRGFSLLARNGGEGSATAEDAEALPRLRFLDLSITEFSDDGIRHLARLRSLEWLILSYTRVTGRGMKDLAALPNTKLETIELEGCELGADAVRQLKCMWQLKSLRIRKCGVPKADVEWLTRERPDLADCIHWIPEDEDQ